MSGTQPTFFFPNATDSHLQTPARPNSAIDTQGMGLNGMNSPSPMGMCSSGANGSAPPLPSWQHSSSPSPSPTPFHSHDESQLGHGNPPLSFNQPTTRVTSVAVDNLALDFDLLDVQRDDMQTFTRLASQGDGLNDTQLACGLFILAVLFSCFNRRHDGDANAESFKTMLKELRTLLDDNFKLTNEQTKNIRIIVQELLYDPKRVCYKGLAMDVFDYIEKHQAAMRFHNIFGNPARMKVLEKAVTDTSSSVRNSFRQTIRDGMGKSLHEFTLMTNSTYMRAGGARYKQEMVTVKNAILRRFVFDNKALVWADEKADGSDGPDGNVEQGGEEPATKKRKRGGRVPPEKDFWLKVDEWFVKEIEDNKRGTDISSDTWRGYLKDVVAFDVAGFREPAPVPFSAVSQQSAPAPVNPSPPSPPASISAQHTANLPAPGLNTGFHLNPNLPTQTRMLNSSFGSTPYLNASSPMSVGSVQGPQTTPSSAPAGGQRGGRFLTGILN
ncbi:hypothetical protein VNI00_008106 [Paramarasmius palmivorus]|uniref:Uncharacterized protein n=1 Tax=Paramarasmius palmivorus TaxID=297713 RepID=A0AAW0CXL4_9AGAR